MNNTFPTDKDWKTFVQKYEVPEKIAKAYAKKVLELYKLFESSGLSKGTPTFILASQVDVAKKFIAIATKTSHEFTKAIDLDSDMPKVAREKLKERWATIMLKPIQNLFDAVRKVVDPFAQSRANVGKAVALYEAWLEEPENVVLLTEMYGQGMRNHLGANFNSPPSVMTTEVKDLVSGYQKTVSKWMKFGLNQTDAEKLVKDPRALEVFKKDMKQLITDGKAILEKTKPKG